jgi:hypothetical protein
MGESTLLSGKALQQNLGVRESQAHGKRSSNIVSYPMFSLFVLILTLISSLSGEATKLVIDNYLRSLTYGTKYVFQTLPKLLTLWLEHASIVEQPIDPKRGDNE